MSQYFSKTYEPFGGDINVKVDLSNNATKADIRNISRVDTSSFALKTNLANLKTEVDKLDIHKLVPISVNLSKLKTFDFRYFIRKSHFEEDGTQNHLVFQPIYRYFKVFSITQYLEYVSEWKSKGLSSESFKAISTSDNSLTPALNYYGTKTRVKFTGSCLKQPKISYTHGKVVNIYIVYELGASSSNCCSDFNKKRRH